MKKLLFLIALLFLAEGKSFAVVQIDGGQEKSASKSVYFVGRYGRTNVIGTNGQMISKDRVVVWDSTSNDGVSVNLGSTSHDALVAGITIDDIPGTSGDATAANSLGGTNWGRVRVYGRHADVSWDQSRAGINSLDVPAGSRVSVSGRTGALGAAGMFRQISADSTHDAVSRDSFGITLEAGASSDKTIDIFVKNM